MSDVQTNHVVLIIEDETDIRDVYSEMLRSSGYQVKEAGDGTAGLAIVKEGDWDLLLLDIMLPGEDGMHILRAIREDAKLAGKPVVLLTNLANETFISECFDLGASGYLIKSEIDPGKIVEEVKNYIGN